RRSWRTGGLSCRHISSAGVSRSSTCSGSAGPACCSSPQAGYIAPPPSVRLPPRRPSRRFSSSSLCRFWPVSRSTSSAATPEAGRAFALRLTIAGEGACMSPDGTPDLRAIEVIAPNLKRRLSGVTATVVRLVPLQARRIGIAATGPGLPPHVPHVPLWRLFLMPRDRLRVWHARRNTEMALGLVLRGVFRRRLALLFTSASQRRHTGYTRRLIARMDGLVAT